MAVNNLNKKWSSKKNNAKQRGISFDLTVQEFSVLQQATHCDYTGEAFSENVHRSIERIDDKQGYTFSNCIVVTTKANLLKDCFVDKDKKCSIKPEDLPIIERIQKVLAENTPEQLTEKYRLRLSERLNKHTKQRNDTITPQNNKEANMTVEFTSEIDYINEYKRHNDRDKSFSISFSLFKKLMQRKTCMVSGASFQESYSYNARVLIKKDNDTDWGLDNAMVVTGVVKTLFDSDVSCKELGNVVNFISNKC